MKRSPSSSQLARWFGEQTLDDVSKAMRGWYGPPIAFGLSPSRIPIRAHADGDFSGGGLQAGGFSGLLDHLDAVSRLALRGTAFNAGFASVTDLLFKIATGRRHSYNFNKAAQSAVLSGSVTWWGDGALPAAGGSGGAAPAGSALSSATTGAIALRDPDTAAGETAHFAGGVLATNNTASALGGAALVYDRLWSCAKTMSSVAAEAVTGVPTRYQGAPGAADSGEGNFVFPEVLTTLGATAHNFNTCQYTNQSGTAGQSIPSTAGVSSQSARRLDLPISTSWFLPLQAGDRGVRALSQIQLDASVTGALEFVIGHPIGWLPSIVLSWQKHNGLRRPMQLGSRIFAGACLAFLEVCKPVANNTTSTGVIEVVYG